MLYSSAGVMTNTFSHEISRIMTKTGSRMQHIREAIKRSVGEYKGNELFNPYSLISAAENIDKLIENWITILMSGTSNESFSKKTTNIYYYIDSILIKWKPLLKTKLIKVSPRRLPQTKPAPCLSPFSYMYSSLNRKVVQQRPTHRRFRLLPQP